METIVSPAPQSIDVKILRIEGDAGDCSREMGRLEPLLDNLLATDLRYLVVDLAAVSDIGCIALSKLMCAVILLRGTGGDMVFAAAQDSTLESLKSFGVEKMVHTYATVEAAINAVRGPITGSSAERL